MSQDCQPEACAIQTCIQRNNYDTAKCHAQVKALYTCCSQMYERMEREGKHGERGSESCPLKDIVERRLRGFEREEQK